MSVVRDFILTVVKKDSVVSVVSEDKQYSERSQIFHFNSSKVKQCSERNFSVSYTLHQPDLLIKALVI